MIWPGILLPIIWEKFHEKCADSWCWRSDGRHVINQLADKQTIKQTLFARQPAKSTNPIQLIARLLWGCTESCSTEAGHAGTGCCVCQPYGEDLDIQANSVIAAMKACDVKRLIFVLSLGIYNEVP